MFYEIPRNILSDSSVSVTFAFVEIGICEYGAAVQCIKAPLSVYFFTVTNGYMHFILSVVMFFSNIKPAETLPLLVQKGKASFYAKKFSGRRTAYGERVRAEALEGAHRSLPLNTLVEVTNLSNQRSVVIRINDRGPFAKGRVVDLTYAAAKAIGMISQGVVNVSLRVVGTGKPVALVADSLAIR